MARSRKGTLRDEQKRVTRARLLEAARVAFAAGGYVGTSVDGIAAAAGTSRATFYLHFEGKLDALQMLTAALLPDVLELYAELDDVLEDGDRDALLAWFVRALEWFEEHRDMLPAADEAMAVNGPTRVRGSSCCSHSWSGTPRVDRCRVPRRPTPLGSQPF